MRRVQHGPPAGLIVQFVLLAGLGATVGLGPAGWLAGLGCRRAGGARWSPRSRASPWRSPPSGLLPPAAANVLLAGALALLVESFGRDVGWLWQRRPDAVRDDGPGARHHDIGWGH
ncbi:hypothetical protein OOK41_16625 [Micromonospora sp. NBC_01655]|uniref:hypothetical protein n=1 Tax=Micromonospora sp. NBC_01655 TaxID=2975983 RepID=UPI00224CC5B6|nr:hypothetical protein [Micromonospora sp. NBC_01655]MCX4471914.1 hypothetical protein [Micromonospora sp. NBC_01655]